MFRKRAWTTRIITTGMAVLAVNVACSGGEEESGSGGRAGTGGSSGVTAGSGGGVSVGSGGSGVGLGSDAGFEECAATQYEAEGIRLDMYVMLDHTGSMGEDCPLDLAGAPRDSTKWCYATHALAQYFTSDYAAGHRAALQFMSLPDGVCRGGPENAEAYAEVDLTPLPVTASSELVSALDRDAPTGGLGTQIEAALHGIATYTAANRSAGRTMIGVFITDGDPNGCDDDVDNLAQIIAEHYEQTSIRTFVIGMTGATLRNLETLARVGGAPEHTEHCGDGVDSCHYWSVGDGDPAVFVDALRQIQAVAVLPCEYTIPEAPSGERLDPNLVNVTFDDEAGQRVILQTTGPDDCDADGGGWYYDDPVTPTSIRLCPASCDLVQGAGASADLKIAHGCATQTRPPE